MPRRGICASSPPRPGQLSCRPTSRPPRSFATGGCWSVWSAPASGQVEGHGTWEVFKDPILETFLEEQPEAWQTEHVGWHYDREAQRYIADLTTPACDALLEHVAISPVFGSEAERNYYTTFLQWRIKHGVRRIMGKPFQATNVPAVLRNQLSLLDGNGVIVWDNASLSPDMGTE
jgi:hypothetical protein